MAFHKAANAQTSTTDTSPCGCARADAPDASVIASIAQGSDSSDVQDPKDQSLESAPVEVPADVDTASLDAAAPDDAPDVAATDADTSDAALSDEPAASVSADEYAPLDQMSEDFETSAEDASEDESDDTQDSLTFSNGVIEKIVALAMREVPGVVGMKGSWFNRVQDVLGASDSRKGVSVEVSPDASVVVTISVLIKYGAYAPTVFEDVKRVVVSTVYGMTGLTVAGVNLRIEDVLTPEEYEAQDMHTGDAPAAPADASASVASASASAALTPTADTSAQTSAQASES